ncbi:hypothetical protein [Streptomyces sp. NPDC088156]|uniref:hypothetical protein n=2 Tax=unclassified Streptomyces TaxID=2593676 RepID=UPI0037F95563
MPMAGDGGSQRTEICDIGIARHEVLGDIKQPSCVDDRLAGVEWRARLHRAPLGVPVPA